MIEWQTDPVLMTDEELVREYLATDGTGDRADALAAEIHHRNLDI